MGGVAKQYITKLGCEFYLFLLGHILGHILSINGDDITPTTNSVKCLCMSVKRTQSLKYARNRVLTVSGHG
jgi:hypothetical protein